MRMTMKEEEAKIACLTMAMNFTNSTEGECYSLQIDEVPGIAVRVAFGSGDSMWCSMEWRANDWSGLEKILTDEEAGEGIIYKNDWDMSKDAVHLLDLDD